ncbi:hypothetical protein An11g03560 [Aspergillus niger]|uniref:Uncharacterized protein n=2 Tax=Aspergillus niger TaxID=5061 RepID=A2QW22_ASPNC|nr:hypothetical protein An11g03560 [Aspergillus niger]CAK48345.1 hypothetical protein An11g03560 [Aspergillus niger]
MQPALGLILWNLSTSRVSTVELRRYPLTHSLHISNYNPIHESGRPAYTIHNLPIVPNSSLLLFDPITSVVFSGLIKQLTMLASRLVPIRTAQPIGAPLEAVAVAPLFFDDEQLFDNPIDTLHWLVIGFEILYAPDLFNERHIDFTPYPFDHSCRHEDSYQLEQGGGSNTYCKRQPDDNNDSIY